MGVTKSQSLGIATLYCFGKFNQLTPSTTNLNRFPKKTETKSFLLKIANS